MSGQHAWRPKARELAVAHGSDFPRPEFTPEGVPLCSESCRYHDGKRCELSGFRPDRICEPVVQAMAEMLDHKPTTEPKP